MKQSNNPGREGTVSGIVGIVSNLALFLMKLSVGFAMGSLSLISDAFNNMSDFLNSGLMYVGFAMSMKPADEDHPYGHERFELIAGFCVSLVMLFLGLETLKTAILSLIKNENPTLSSVYLLVIAVSILVKSCLAVFYYKRAKRLDSRLILANYYDSLNDVAISVLMLVGYFLAPYTSLNVDALLSVLIALIIIVTALKMIQQFISDLLGQRASKEDVMSITQILNQQDDIHGYHDLKIHNYGRFHKYALVHCEVDELMSLNQAHSIIDRIEDEVYHKTGIELDVHLDPLDLRSPIIKQLVYRIKTVLLGIHKELDFHDVRLNEKVLSFDVVNPQALNIKDEYILGILQGALDEYVLEVLFDATDLLIDYDLKI